MRRGIAGGARRTAMAAAALMLLAACGAAAAEPLPILGEEMVPADPRRAAPSPAPPATAAPALEAPAPPPPPGARAPMPGPTTLLPPRGAEEEAAFRSLLRMISPMDEAQLRVLRQLLDRQALVLAEPPSGVRPTPRTRAISLTLRPGEELPRLRLFPGNATSITFSDVTGAPWPVQSFTVGNPQAFAASEAGERGRTNMLVVSPLASRIVANNLVVSLAGHPVPVVFAIEAGGEEIDFRVDVTVRARGPHAVPEPVRPPDIPPTDDRTIQAFLDGVPPSGAEPLRTSHRDVDAWRFRGRMYLRSPFEVMSPAWRARARHVSGAILHVMDETPVVLMTERGRMFQLRIPEAGNPGGAARARGERMGEPAGDALTRR